MPYVARCVLYTACYVAGALDRAPLRIRLLPRTTRPAAHSTTPPKVAGAHSAYAIESEAMDASTHT
jgi:hypothetical protein